MTTGTQLPVAPAVSPDVANLNASRDAAVSQGQGAYAGSNANLASSVAATPVIDTNSPVNATAIQGTTPVTYPSASSANTTQSNTRLGATVGGQALTAQGTVAQPPAAPATPATNDRSSALSSILGIFKQQQNESADTQAANTANDVSGKQQKMTDLTNQLASTSAAYDQKIEQAQKNIEGKFGGAVQQDVDNITRQKNQDLANISIQLNAANGNYTTAAAIAKQAVDAKYAPLKDELATLQSYYQLSANTMTDSEKMQAQAQIDTKQKAVDAQTQKDLEQYKNQLTQSDPLHAAQVAAAWANVAQSNAAAAKSNAETAALGSAPNYNGDFSATIGLASNTGGTNAQRAATKQNLQGLIAQKDYPSAYAAILQATASGLNGTNKTDFQNRLEQYSVTQDLNSALQALKATGYDTNKLTGGADAVGTKIGLLTTDPKYAAVANQLNLAYQNYRHQMTGAAFSANEAAQYASVLPSSGNSFALNSAKIDGLNSFLTSTIDGYTKQVVGQGGVEIRKYAQGATPADSSSGDQYASYRSQVPTGDILVNRSGQVGSIPSNEFNPKTDTKL